MSDDEKKTIAGFDRVAAAYAKKTSPGYWDQVLDIFSGLIPESGNVLDLGCGNGRDSDFFLRNKYDYLGVDASEGMLREAQAHFPKARFELCNMYDLNSCFQPKTFDAVWCCAAFHHIHRKNTLGVMQDITRILKNGGAACFVMGYLQSSESDRTAILSSGNEAYFNNYSPDQFRQLLRQANFSLLSEMSDERSSRKDHYWFIYMVRKS